MTDKNEVRIGMLLHAPVEAVWKAWTDPDIVLSWFGSDPGGKGIKATIDPRPGGYFEVSFANSDETAFTCMGVYKEVKVGRRLVFSWMWENEPGVESVVTVELVPEGDFTRMLFEHGDPGTASAHDYGPGWQRTFGKLERVLVGGGDNRLHC